MPILRRLSSRSKPAEADENVLEGTGDELNLVIPCPLPRTPLNSIPDPSQNPKDGPESECDYYYKAEFTSLAKGISGTGTPRSAQSTPTRAASRISHSHGSRPPLHVALREKGSSSRAVRGALDVKSWPSAQAVHFELEEDPSFWEGHSVQVVIRIRPIDTAESALQGYGSCLRQESSKTLTWTGHPETRFTFDHIACEIISQEKLFRAVGVPMVENCMSGYNSCMFAYGQTGSGKTYTMMGEIWERDNNVSENRGMTPRIFEYLFMRIREEETNRKEEKLNYNCKCSFLEIYNEQITDLLDPSSTNLQLREDVKKGVYVENLQEYEVRTVKDVITLLLQGAANRKIAATNMNSESSRSHSLFTCTIESQWEKDAMTHFRFSRLHLVDLAGSERQKSSGAEGERLKEAANINRSLSTLGLVIMNLVDIAHGKHRHVPYRDSRLTFLLQDSLGGNSKTTIIATISPSICSANETLSTLKFAQRAKLIQNNAKVNEDASGDLMALQQQIQKLKEQLSFLANHHHASRPLCCTSDLEIDTDGNLQDNPSCSPKGRIKINPDTRLKKTYAEATVIGALRREKVADDAVRALEAEIEHMRRLVSQMEDDSVRVKMMVKIRDEKIRRLELLADGLISADNYLTDENYALSEEIKILKAKLEKNPELTRFAIENVKLTQHLRKFQDFYRKGEREALLDEISDLRNQLLEVIEKKELQTNIHLSNFSEADMKLNRDTVPCPLIEIPAEEFYSTSEELSNCREKLASCLAENSKLTREIEDLRHQLKVAFHSLNDGADYTDDRITLANHLGCRGDISNQEEYRIGENEEVPNSKLLAKCDKMSASLEDARICDAQFCYCHESQLSFLHKLKEIQQETEAAKTNFCLTENFAKLQDQIHLNSCHSSVELNSMACKIEHQEIEKSMDAIQKEKNRLSQLVFTQEAQINALNEDWEKAVGVLAGFLADGYESLENASDQIQRIIYSFPQGRGHVDKHIKQVISICHEKEKLIHILQMKLEDAQIVGLEMTSKLESLRKAALAMTGVQKWDDDEHANELSHLKALINEKDSEIQELQNANPHKEYQIMNVIKRVTSMFITMKLLFEMEDTQSLLLKNKKSVIDDPAEINCESDIAKPTLDASFTGDHNEVDILMDDGASLPCEKCEISVQKLNIKNNVFLLQDVQAQINNAVEKFMESSSFLFALLKDTKNLIPFSVSDLYHIYSEVCKAVQGLGNDTCIMKNQFVEIRRNDFNVVLHSSSERKEPKKCIEQCRNLHSVGYIFSILSKAIINLKAGIEEVIGPSTEPSKPELNVLSQLQSSVTVGDYSASASKLQENTAAPENLTFNGIINEMELVHGSLMQIFINMAEIFLCNGHDKCSYWLQGQNQALDILCCLQRNCPDSFEMQNLLDLLERKIDKTERECSRTANTLQLKLDNAEILTEEKSRQADDLLRKLEEAQQTMEEADVILNVLLKLNESAKNEKNMWQETSEDLLAEKAGLTAEIHGLMVSKSLIQQQNEILQNQVHESLVDTMDALSSLNVYFQQMREDTERNLKALYHDIFSSWQEMLDFVSTVRACLKKLVVKKTDEDSSNACECHGKSNAPQLKNTYREFSFGRGCENESSYIVCDDSEDRLSVKDGVLKQTKDTLQMLHLRNESAYSESHKVGSVKPSVGSLIDNPITNCEGYDTSNMECSIWEERKQEIYDVSGMHNFFKNDIGQVDIAIDNSLLKKELIRKDILLKGVLFDFKLLQESASNIRTDKDESERMLTVLNRTQHELFSKTAEANKFLDHQRELECRLVEKEAAHNILLTDLKQAQKSLNSLLNENNHLKALIDDAYIKKAYVEKQLLDKNKVIDSLETEIFSSNSLVEENMLSSVREIEDELRRVKEERDHLLKEAVCLQGKLDLMSALADENEAVALEARQVSEANKSYAEQKEEEVKILECSVEELEETINVLERKVCDMVEEVDNHRIKKEQLEQEVCILRQRVLTVESATEILDMPHSESGLKIYMPRKIDSVMSELHQTRKTIVDLQVERQKQEEEIKRYKEHISELILHSEAQSSLYHQKFKMLEAMTNEEKSNHPACSYAASNINEPERALVRPRGSSSPFKCIAGLVQQMYSEKDQELSFAKLHIEELEAQAHSQKKEVCKLTARLAQVDNMTHDVIRDLLEVKLDMTAYANLIDQEELQKLLQDAQQQNEDNYGEEMLHLMKQIDNLKEERDSWIKEINQIRTEILTSKIAVERGQQRDQFLTAQNEMLKMDKLNLTRKITELDETIKKLAGSRSIEEVILQENIVMENSSKAHDDRFLKRLGEADRLLTRAKHERAFGRNSKCEEPSNFV